MPIVDVKLSLIFIKVGTAFAINIQNFWDLGSYDEGLKIWQGENLDLSFKASLCGIGIVEGESTEVLSFHFN